MTPALHSGCAIRGWGVRALTARAGHIWLISLPLLLGIGHAARAAGVPVHDAGIEHVARCPGGFAGAAALVDHAPSRLKPIRIAQRGGSPSKQPPPPPPIPIGSAALTQSLASCSDSYHAALAAIHAANGERLKRAVRAMSLVDDRLPGRWLFWGPAGHTGKQKIETQFVCTSFLIGGERARCGRFEQRRIAGPIPAQVAAKAATADELKALRLVDETVKGKGALVEFGGNGRYKVMSERFADDLRGYATQPKHPALCTGSEDLVAFYRETLAPLRKRISVVAAATAQTRKLAHARFQIAAAALSVTAGGVLASSGDGGIAAAEGDAKQAPASADPPPVPASHRDMVIELIRLAADGDVARAVAGGETDIAVLLRAQAWVASERAHELLPTQRQTLLAALQLIEASVYADTLRVRYVEIDETLFGSLEQLASAQRSSCTCSEE